MSKDLLLLPVECIFIFMKGEVVNFIDAINVPRDNPAHKGWYLIYFPYRPIRMTIIRLLYIIHINIYVHIW
jgi:hypothetical protein